MTLPFKQTESIADRQEHKASKISISGTTVELQNNQVKSIKDRHSQRPSREPMGLSKSFSSMGYYHWLFDQAYFSR